MIFGTILLDINDKYIDKNGELPERPYFDKHLLTALVENNRVSPEGYELLPPSIQKVAKCTALWPTLPITVPEISELSDLLMVVRSYNPVEGGKVFRMDNFTQIARTGRIEIYKRRKDVD